MLVNLYSFINGLDRFELNHTLSSTIVSEGKSTPTLTTAKVADYVIDALALLTVIGTLVALCSIGINTLSAPGIVNWLAITMAGSFTFMLQDQYRTNLVHKIKDRMVRNCILNHSSA